jgi:hypothetical protein
MILHKLSLFTLAATLAVSTNVGTLDVQIREFEVPTPKSRPHDPARARRLALVHRTGCKQARSA